MRVLANFHQYDSLLSHRSFQLAIAIIRDYDYWVISQETLGVATILSSDFLVVDVSHHEQIPQGHEAIYGSMACHWRMTGRGVSHHCGMNEEQRGWINRRIYCWLGSDRRETDQWLISLCRRNQNISATRIE